MQQSRTYTGASHIPLIEHDGKLCVVLFGEPRYGIHIDSGGHAEAGENPIQTACREGREESLNTFDIDTESIALYSNYYTIGNMVNYKDYYAFFIKYNLTFQDMLNIYEHNRHIIFSNNSNDVPDFWKESNSVSIFTIDSLLECYCRNYTRDGYYFNCTDVFGNSKIVFRRPIKYVINAIKSNMFIQNEGKWSTDIPNRNIKTYKNSTDDFLNDTISIRIFI